MLSRAQVRVLRDVAGRGDHRVAVMFGALSDAGRFGIFRLIMKRRDLCVTEVANVFTISVPAASQQLKVMELSGLVVRERRGQKICYSIRRSDPVVRSLVRIVSGIDDM
jgi:ArsR family transcriptional regulator